MKFSTPFQPARWLMLAAALTLGSAAWAVPEAQFAPAFNTFARAAAGDMSAVGPSANALEALLQAEPGNPVLMAYSGAATAMRAGTTWLPWKKMSYAEDGLALLDKALAMLTAAHNQPLQHDVPAVLEVRFVAARTFLAVPGFMNRAARGTQLLSDVRSSPLFGSAPLGFRADVWLAAADQAVAHQRHDEARQYLNQVIGSSAPQAAAARAKLQALAS